MAVVQQLGWGKITLDTCFGYPLPFLPLPHDRGLIFREGERGTQRLWTRVQGKWQSPGLEPSLPAVTAGSPRNSSSICRDTQAEEGSAHCVLKVHSSGCFQRGGFKIPLLLALKRKGEKKHTKKHIHKAQST